MTYTELDVWLESRKLVSRVYELTKGFPKEEVFGLTSQVRRSVVSIPSNITEGCGRSSSRDTVHFLVIARGSMYELETQLFLSSDLNYITQKDLSEALQHLSVCRKLLSGFINYYKGVVR